MQDDRQKKTAGTDEDIRKTTGTTDPHERTKSNPTADELTDPKEVWKDAETTPSQSGAERVDDEGGSGRVADAGDIGGGQPAPYSTETQADALAKQSMQKKDQRGIDKLKR